MSGEYSSVVERHQAFLEMADDEHPAAKIEERFARHFRQHDDCDLFKTVDFVNADLIDIVSVRRLYAK